VRLGTFLHQGKPTLFAQFADTIVPLTRSNGGPSTMLELIDGGAVALERLASRMKGAGPGQSIAEAPLLAPIPRPRKNIMCLGWNYVEHAKEGAAARGVEAELPTHPVVFTKSPASVNSPRGDIPWDPAVSTQLDWEVELAVIIATGGRRIPQERALDHVFGYTVINDVSARDVQFRHKQYFLGKSLDGACPMGPVIVTRDEIPDPQVLDVISRVNGEVKQSSNTRHQIFTVAAAIALLSDIILLEPGDVIATGTPAGVGFARTPPQFLKPGDVVECEVENIGVLRNRVVAVDA
jgi:2-keto-4-pentenoate hydratase/2-oxohepta-3-ene-1,7-dioic acid hydratase in catechol pathway